MCSNVYINLPTSTNEFECFSLTTGQLLYTATGHFTGGIDLPGNSYAQASATTGVNSWYSSGGSYGNSPTPYLFGQATLLDQPMPQDRRHSGTIIIL